MKTAQDWNWEYTQICANDPAVNGQLLPTPQMVKFIERIQSDALYHAAAVCESQFEPRDGEQDDGSNGHANRGVENCQDAIRAAAKSLNAPDQR